MPVLRAWALFSPHLLFRNKAKTTTFAVFSESLNSLLLMFLIGSITALRKKNVVSRMDICFVFYFLSSMYA